MSTTLQDEPIIDIDDEPDPPNPIDAALDRDVRTNRALGDTPIARVSVAHLPVDELDNMLQQLRERRIARAQLAQQMSQVKLAAVEATERMKFQRQYDRLVRLHDKIAALDARAEDELRKFRVMQIIMSEEA